MDVQAVVNLTSELGVRDFLQELFPRETAEAMMAVPQVDEYIYLGCRACQSSPYGELVPNDRPRKTEPKPEHEPSVEYRNFA